ncbi:RagB/SusD family nutrient uptake outer membrane protein [Fulvivirga sp. M361]|uniref:RagB/SusD family nutrient uptake outer membrane protein n=1 Tax=Fulvivirga sp. M361 TaxID=2594266 RepID=UPI00117B3EA5|nr:RagB/SusD family nutrient uptake outer membrane protein [Fulvivirga sp. M361]TRX59601.1 RagB/SusD family nutrient uptake outer membrane protein [Fulvivirga sp. M361]
MKKLIYPFYLICFFFIPAGCDFLDEEPESFINSATFYKTESDAVAATNALYEYLTVGTEGIFDRGFGGIFFNDYWVFKDILSDNCTETIVSQEYRTLNEFTFTAENERIELYWQDLYKTINASNVVIDRVPLIDMNEMRRDHLTAEAHFIRAMMYFEAVRLFGDVPLILKETVDLDDAIVARSAKDNVYEAIVGDLEWARDHLSSTYRVGSGRPTPMACTALLAKVYLEMGEHELSANQAEIVITSNEYRLFDDFADLFKLENANSGEIIFAVNYSGTLSQGFKPNQYHVRLLPPNLHKDGEGPENAFGWEVPTAKLYNSYDALDRRREVTFITSFTYSDNSTVTFDPHISKFWDRENEPLGNNTDQDVVYLRLADIMLIYAEALNEVNNGPTAIAYQMINDIRKRARFNGTVEQAILPDLAGLDYQQFKDAILQERQWEFVMEGQRYHDLVRMGKLVEAVNTSGKLNVNPQPFHNLLPIPQRERDLNPKLSQNDDY